MIPRPNDTKDELPAGSTLGKYEILRKLATGGMAELYIARARGVAGFEKTVVLKRILPGVAADAAFVQMFLDEARLAAALQHPNIADVYDVGEVGGTPFFTMEYVHGQDVRSIRVATRKREEPVPLAISLAIIHGTAAALDHAHERLGADGRPLELVHRDVSASNIIVSYDGAIKLLDFGIARATSHQHKTQIGTLKGKTPYMSPEQCRAQRLDRRSDLFSLGTVMFELTVGRRPFRGENDFAIMEQIVHGEAPRPSTLAPGYPAQLEAIVMKLLARRVEARYQTAEELLHDLEAFIAEHQLWVSSKQLGKYMRLVFADRIEAWERAAHDGVPLSQHVAETITSESQKSELVTPHTVFPRIRRLSQELPAMATPSAQMPAVAPPPPSRPPAEDDFANEAPTVAVDEPPAGMDDPTVAVADPMALLDDPAAAIADPEVEIAGPEETPAPRPRAETIEPPTIAVRPSVRLPPVGPMPVSPMPVSPMPVSAPPMSAPPMSAPPMSAPPMSAMPSPPPPERAASIYPKLARSSRGLLLAVLLLLLGGAIAGGVYAWPHMFPRRSPDAAPAAAPAPPTEASEPPARTRRTPTRSSADEPATAAAAPAEPPPAEPPPAEPPPAEPPPAEPPPAITPATAPAAAPRPSPPRPARPHAPSPKQPEERAWDRDPPSSPPR